MSGPYLQLYVHCVWSTFDRLPLIHSEYESRLYAAIAAKCQQLNCRVLAIGGDADHVHLFVSFPATLAIAQLMKEVKGATSHLVNHEFKLEDEFKWQGGYGAFTVSKRSVESVVAYVRSQKEHHADRKLIDELEKNIDYADER